MRRVLVRIVFLTSIIFVGEALAAIGFRATLGAFQAWIVGTSLVVLLGAAFAIFREPGPGLSDLQMDNFMVSSATKRLLDPGSASPPGRKELVQVILGTGLVLGGAALLMFLFV